MLEPAPRRYAPESLAHRIERWIDATDTRLLVAVPVIVWAAIVAIVIALALTGGDPR